MRKKKILLVFGTRPEAIKMSPLVLSLKNQDKFDIQVCLTGQHREMLDQVMKIFNIKADYDINIMQQKQDLYDITSRVIIGMRDVLNLSKPDVILVHGDTTTSMATSLAAYYQQIPIGHIEAGLRTRDIYSPWPEEINRQITGRIATYHFAPTTLSKQNLIEEGVIPNNIYVTGNTVITALKLVLNNIKKDVDLETRISAQLLDCGYNISRLTQKRKMV